MNVTIGGNGYMFLDDIRKKDDVRAGFNRLAVKTFGLDFEDWYRSGCWGDRYIPYVLLDDGRVVANVSVNLMDFIIEGCRRRYLQLGTVMTDSGYRGRGLARFLIKKALADWKAQCAAVYLYANDSVLDFYPRFGFKKAGEFQYSGKLPPAKKAARKLDMDVENDRSLLLQKYRQSNPYSALAMRDNAGLMMFYCAGALKESVYYVEDADVAVIVEKSGEHMLCYEVFGAKKEGLTLKDVLRSVAAPGTLEVALGFTPVDADGFAEAPLEAEDTTLFVLSGKEDVFGEKKLMFPLLSHA